MTINHCDICGKKLEKIIHLSAWAPVASFGSVHSEVCESCMDDIKEYIDRRKKENGL